MHDSYQALNDFRSVWHKLDRGDVVSTGRFKVLAKIGYHSPLQIESTQSTVTIVFDGREAGS
uniref:hypothetical protein n=1 Tax=Novosphingobium sp. TaxID=1874826 RepID=UPI00286D18FE